HRDMYGRQGLLLLCVGLRFLPPVFWIVRVCRICFEKVRREFYGFEKQDSPSVPTESTQNCQFYGYYRCSALEQCSLLEFVATPESMSEGPSEPPLQVQK